MSNFVPQDTYSCLLYYEVLFTAMIVDAKNLVKCQFFRLFFFFLKLTYVHSYQASQQSLTETSR